MAKKNQGTLIIIGGHEKKEEKPEILSEVAKRTGKDGKLVIVTVATELPEEMGQDYRTAFTDLGVRTIEVLDIRTREDASEQGRVEQVTGASVIFFTGGDQLRITSQLGDSLVFRAMLKCFAAGCTIAGTSAGAAAMPETMIVTGNSDESTHVSSAGTISSLHMAPGLGFLPGVVIDSHFAERGRMGRLLGAVAENPRMLGIGIDENTAIVVHGEDAFNVLGSGAVYVLDGHDITYTSLSEHDPEGVISVYNVKLHVLGQHDCFDLHSRRPISEVAADQQRDT